MSEIRIVPTADEHVEGLHRCLDTVAREGRYLGLLQAPPVEASRVFVRGVLESGGVSLVAVDGSGTVVGWCDVQRRMLEGFQHVGTLGVGMLPRVRGQGLGCSPQTRAPLPCTNPSALCARGSSAAPASSTEATTTT